MKIAVLGTGMVGRAIAGRLAELGNAVVIGTRDVSATVNRDQEDNSGTSFREWYEGKQKKIIVSTYAEAALSSDIIFNCTSGTGSIEALKLAGEKNLNGKILIDVANPLDFSRGMPPSLNPCNTDSLAELIQRTFPGLKVVKALNTMNCFLMVNPAIVPGDHNVFVSGNEPDAKSKVIEILKSFGWKGNNIIDLGDITTARGTEQLLPIWLRLWGALQTPMFNFHVVVAPPQKS